MIRVLLYSTHHIFNKYFRGREKGRCDFMTYPDEGRESLEGQMQSYTVSGRRSLHETDV